MHLIDLFSSADAWQHAGHMVHFLPACLGLFGHNKASTSSSSSTTTDTANNASDNNQGLVLTGVSGSTVNVTPNGAFKTVRDATAKAAEVSIAAMNANRSTTADAIASAAKIAETTSKQALDFASNYTAPAGGQVSKLLTVTAVAFVALKVLS